MEKYKSWWKNGVIESKGQKPTSSMSGGRQKELNQRNSTERLIIPCIESNFFQQQH
jgi:hypothetical protein